MPYKNVLPIYISIHLAFFVITCLAVLFIIPDFSWKALPIDTLWQSWYRWDSVHYSYLAVHVIPIGGERSSFPCFPCSKDTWRWSRAILSLPASSSPMPRVSVCLLYSTGWWRKTL